MGFFDGLRRDRRNQQKKSLGQEKPQEKTVEKPAEDAASYTKIDASQEIETVEKAEVEEIEKIEEVEDEAKKEEKPAVQRISDITCDPIEEDVTRIQQPIKSYAEKKPVTHVIGQTKIIAIINQKGGVGKSTTAINLSAALGERGKQVLLIDLDPQGNTTSGLGVEKGQLGKCIYNVLLEDVPIEETIIPDVYEGLDLVPATINLAGAEVELVSEMARENRLKDAVGALRGKYDYIFIDCPPSLGLLTVNSLVAADKLLIPIQCEFYALEGVTKLLDSMKRVKSRLNPSLEIFGILLTMYDSRTTLSKQVAAEVRNYFGKQTFEVVIPRTVKLSEAPSYGMPITQYDPTGKGALSYSALAEEVINRG